VSAFGPVKGTINREDIELRTITTWPTSGVRKAFLVEPFVASQVVPGMKTRRLDRLSVWALVASSLALQDAKIELQNEDMSKGGVVFGTGFGPLDLTSAFCASAATYGFAGTDAIVFPETLDNTAACHVAKMFGMKGPNITVSCRGISGEAAFIRAASILECGEADFIVVMAGDSLVRALYEYYESIRVLAADCFGAEPKILPGSSRSDGFVPGEGLAALVLESGDRYRDRGAMSYGSYGCGRMGGDPTATPFSWGQDINTVIELIGGVLGSVSPADVRLIVGAANGSSILDSMESQCLRGIFGMTGTPLVMAPKKCMGTFDGDGLLRLVVAISQLRNNAGLDISFREKASKSGNDETRLSEGNLLLLLGASTGGGRAAMTIELPR
jgi:3-oxoacyl-[acyl-carrier-protein] synthase II